MPSSGNPDRIFNETLIEKLEELKGGARDMQSVEILPTMRDGFASVDVARSWELRAYACAANDSFDNAEECFECALRLKCSDTKVMVRWLAMLGVTGQADKVKEKFVQFRSSLDGDLIAMGAAIHVLGYVGLLHDAFHLRERVAALGGEPGPDVIGGEFWLGTPPDLGIAEPLSAKKYSDPWPCGAYKFSLADAEEILADQGLSTDAWSEPIGCALRFLRCRGLKVVAVRSSFIPHLDGPSSMHFQLVVQAKPDVCWDAEWEFCGVLVEESFLVIDSGAASIAFIPTLMESSIANLA
ncbi:hypothetical protein [Stenotrophomonas rhizophila]|uniref:hypothetical protein n=1 Tax=Stenotrophomonas rhizophila TaxID=216778 RepID=UPI00339993AF